MKHINPSRMCVVLLSVVLLAWLLISCASPIQRADPLADLQQTAIPWKIAGKSALGRPIYLYEIGEGKNVVLVLGGTHGDEEVGAQVVIRLAEELLKHGHDTLKQKVILIPLLNPDGTAAGARTNARGVDINRNFPTRNWSPEASRPQYNPGPSPASEPETRLVMDVLEQYSPALVISIHSALHMINYDGPAKAIAERMGSINGYRVSGDIGYPTPGSFGTYAGVERSIPVITLELPAVQIEEAWWQNREALLTVIMQ